MNGTARRGVLRLRMLARAAIVGCVLSIAAPVSAQDRGRDGNNATVVRLDGTEMVLDVGSETGTADGETFRLYRPIEVRHPITHRVIRDRFPIGEVRITSLGRVLSLARPTGTLSRQPAVGDELVSNNAPSAPPQHVVTPTTARAAEPRSPAGATEAVSSPPWNAAPAMAPDARDALSAFVQSLGRAPEARIAIYRDFITRYPGSQYAQSFQTEIAALRAGLTDRNTVYQQLVEARRARDEAATAEREAARGPALHGERLLTMDEGNPAEIALQLGAVENIAGALLHVRREPGSAYDTAPVPIDGHGFVRARVAAEIARAPGFDYWLELVTRQGAHAPAFGDAENPIHVTVFAPPIHQQPTAGLTRIDLRADFIDRNQLRGNDQYYLLEGDFYQRLRFGPLSGYRVGFSVYRGWGGSLEALDRQNRPAEFRQAVLGYHELEFQVTRLFAIITRLSIGMDLQGIQGGAQLRLRFGVERGVFLMVGAEAISNIGQRAFIQVQFRPHIAVPLGAIAEVTHFEYDGPDPSFRIGLQSGWQVTPWFAIAARASYQARTITHAGPGVGVAATFDW